ncbi:MAG: hypothetical protein FJY85_19075 [Deltaproteobacteria bacterium]|nr:hypothetical protein [Deltaproteobacteria bacterium]
MPDSSRIINGKKFMWDGVVYESKEKAQEVTEKYRSDNFEVEFIEEGAKLLLYTRRKVTKIVLEGEAPQA